MRSMKGSAGRSIAITIVLLLAGCATAPFPTTGSGQPAGAEHATADQSPVVVALLDDADRRLSAGETDAAAASLERALRIEPANPLLWHRLATVRLRQERYEQTEAMAVKSNGLARGDTALMARNWRLIADARTRRGDAAGAQQARERALELERR